MKKNSWIFVLFCVIALLFSGCGGDDPPPPGPVESVELNKSAHTLGIGETYQLIATVHPSNAANKAVEWSSGNAAVATVSEEGLVTAIAVGTALITVKTVDGGKLDTCEVTVSLNPNPVTPAILYTKAGGWAEELGDVEIEDDEFTSFDADTLTFKCSDTERLKSSISVYFPNLTDASDYSKLVVKIEKKSDHTGYNAEVWDGGVFFLEDAEGWIDFWHDGNYVSPGPKNPENGGNITLTFADNNEILVGEYPDQEDFEGTLAEALYDFSGFYLQGFGYGTQDIDWEIISIKLE